MISTHHCVITDLVFTNLLIELLSDIVAMNINSDEVESSHEEIATEDQPIQNSRHAKSSKGYVIITT